MRTILVTGGTGFIGRAVVDCLLRDYPQAELRTLSLPGELRPPSWEGKVQCFAGDITSPADVAAATSGVDTIIHLAALLGAGSYQRHVAVTAGGTEVVLRQALEQGARTVVVSSIAVYGNHVRDRACNEAVGHGPQYGPYCLAKQEQENIAIRYAQELDADCCIARPANVYGAGSFPWVDVVAAALRAEAPLIVDGGQGNAGLVHVNDVATALVALAGSQLRGEAFNVCSELDINWRDYFGDIASALGLSLPASISYEQLYDLARQDEIPERHIVPDTYRYIPLATLALIGSDNRFPAQKLRDATVWRPEVDHESAMEEIRSALKTSEAVMM